MSDSGASTSVSFDIAGSLAWFLRMVPEAGEPEGWIFAAVSCVLTLAVWRAWSAASSSYGSISPRLFRLMMRFTLAGFNRNGVRLSALGAILLPLATLVGMPMTSVMLLFSLVAAGLFLPAVPPTFLFLSSSGRHAIRLWSSIRWKLAPLRICALPDPKQVPRSLGATLKQDNLRIRDGKRWEEVVHALIDIVPVLVVDTRDPTDGLVDEIRRLIDSGHYRRAVFVSGTNGDAPALDVAFGSPLDGITVIRPQDLTAQLGAALLRPAARPDPALVEQILSIVPLTNVEGSVRRSHDQPWEATSRQLVIIMILMLLGPALNIHLGWSMAPLAISIFTAILIVLLLLDVADVLTPVECPKGHDRAFVFGGRLLCVPCRSEARNFTKPDA